MRSRVARTVAVLSVLAVANCFRDTTGLQFRRASFGFRPLLSSTASCGMDVSRVRIRLYRPETNQPALDTTVTFPETADSIRVALTVQLRTGATSEDFDLTLALINAAGDTAYRGGPVRVTASITPASGQVPDVPVSYVGVGMNAAGVRFITAPTAAFFGDTAVFAAVALDSSGNPLSGAPVSYSVAPADSTLAYVPDPCSGRVVARSTRGPAHVIAAVPSGASATSILTAQPRPSAIAIVSGNAQTGSAGATLALPLVVKVTAADGLPVRSVPVVFAATAGGGSVVPATATTDTAGVASAAWTLGASAGTNTATATVTGVAPATFTATAAAAGPAIELIYPGNLLAVGSTVSMGVKLAQPAPAGGVTVTVTSDSTQYVTVASPGTVAFAQGDTLRTIDITGVAIGGTLLHATASGYADGVIFIGVVPNVIVLTQNVTVLVGQSASIGIQVVPAAPTGGLTITLASTDSTIARVTTPTVTIPAGQSTGTATVQGVAPGLAALTATATGYATGGTVVTVTTSGGGPVASTTVTPSLDTLTALNATVQLAAQARDSVGSPVTGSYTWVSRTPGIATVGTSGLVTGLANGSSWVVATEAGGTKDSALIVVQQKVASIQVTPGAVSIHLTGHYTLTATAVDGLGSPVPGVTAFTWSTTAPAVATVDTTGYVVGVTLGNAQIRATNGGITGVSNVSVITAITRIAVVVDTVGAATTDTFSMPSLGLTRRYRAIAHDTLDAVMSGLTFSWASTNGSVAIMNTTTGDTASVTSAANGVTKINATAQGFTSSPGASLTVSQVLASIELSPPAGNPSATVGVGGKVGLVARGKDANSRYIAGGTFGFVSAAPGVATVDTATGVVTGVATGSADITASSGAITSNALTVTVGGTPPLIISFGRDTVSVGRGSSASIPVLLSTPSPTGAPLTVNLTATAFAHWNPASVVISVGQTSANATLVGDSAGTTTVTATDGSGQNYAAGSAVAKVTANMSLASSSYSINATDIATTQVLLSDPSPAGGTYVTFGYGTPGIALVSPDPAFIPAGQLAADIQIHALVGGTTTITPSAIGVNGTASSFTAYAAVLTPSTTLIRLGQGQYEPNAYVYAPTYTNVAIPVTASSSDSNLASVTPSFTIPSGSNYAYFTTTAKSLGSATLTFASPGWTLANSITVVATTPYLGLCCGGNYTTTTPALNMTVYAEDSVRNAHYRTNSLVVHLTSRDPTVMRVLDTVVTINPGAYYNSTGRVIPGGAGGTTYVVATASGHQPDSVLFTVVGPKLQFSTTQSVLGAGQYDPNEYVQTPNNVTAPLTVSLANSNSGSVTVPPAVTIPANSYYQYVTVAGTAAGAAQLIASATGYQPDTVTYIVSAPRLTVSGPTTLNNFGPGGTLTVYTTDSLRTAHYRLSPLAVSVVSTDTNIIKVDSSVVTVDSGAYYNGRAHVIPVGVGTAQVIFTASGHVTLDTLTVTVNTPKISFSFTSALLGRRQHFSSDGTSGFYIQTPDSRTTPLAATITQKQGAVDTLTTTAPTIPAATYYTYLDAYGLAYGKDTLIVSAPGYLPDTAFITVTTSKFTTSGLPGSTTTTNPPLSVTVYTTDSTGAGHYASDTVVVAAVSSDPNVLQPVQPYFRILQGAYYATTTVNVVGPGAASITFTDSAGTGYLPVTTGTVTVTGPALAISNGAPMLGMRQMSGASGLYVYAPNNVATDLVVNLASTDPRVVTVPASVTIPAGSYYAYFATTAQDTVGTIQVQATATGYGTGTTTVQVTQPKFVIGSATQLNTTSPPSVMTVYAADANGTAHYTTEDVAVTLLSTAPSVAAIDSTTVTIPAGAYYSDAATWSPGQIGTSQLQASDARAAYYRYNTGTLNVAVITPSIGFSWGTTTLGIGQYIDGNVTVPDYAVNDITVSLAHAGTPRTNTLVSGQPVSSVVIPAQNYYATIRVAGLSAGTDSLVMTASSPAHNPDTVYTAVGQGRVDPIGSWPSTLAVGDSAAITLYARDQAQNGRYVLAATTFTLAPNANIQFTSGGANSTVITSIQIPADQYLITFYVKGVAQGTGSAGISATNYQSYTTPSVTVTP
jgi:hypothetical protein